MCRLNKLKKENIKKSSLNMFAMLPPRKNPVIEPVTSRLDRNIVIFQEIWTMF